MKYLGIDYGTKRTGLAVSDENGSIAFPYKIIETKSSLANDLADIIEKEEIGEIVIGESKNNLGKDNKLMEDISDLIGQLSLSVGLPIHLEKEGFSSVEASRLTGFSGFEKRNQANQKGRVKSKSHVDDSAAAIILQRYLDKQK